MTVLLAVVAGKFNHTTMAENLPAGPKAWLGDLLLIQPYLGTKSYVIVYWTLVVELGFYVLASVLLVVANLSVRLAVGVTLILTLAAVWTPSGPAWFVLACWPAFACGLLVFHALRAGQADERKLARAFIWRASCW